MNDDVKHCDAMWTVVIALLIACLLGIMGLFAVFGYAAGAW